mgnify:CR=1 FL=1
MTSSAKAALRKQVSSTLRALTASQVATQSAAVLTQLLALPAYTACRSASIYLPMDGGGEVDTWPIVSDLFGRGASVAVPRVSGPRSDDMVMLRLPSLEEAQALPRTKWGIPEPDAESAAKLEDMTTAPDVTLILVPGVAFDTKCGRLGHGRGYYDHFISRQRALPRANGAELIVVGLSLSEQIIEAVPMGEHDERLDMVITPDGPLAYTSAADQAHAASLMAAGAAAAGAAAAGLAAGGAGAETAAEASGPSLKERIQLATGTFKYACVRLTPVDGGAPLLAVRSGPGKYHANVAEPVVGRFTSEGYRCEPLGGGRIIRDDEKKEISIYGHSVGFGGADGGPPGHGMRDHAEVAALVRRALPEYAVSWDPDGY